MSPPEFISGAIFGAALVAAGVYEPNVIKSQMDFSSNTMITVMMGASATSAIVLDIEDRFQLLPKKHRAASNLGFFPYDGNVLGGCLIGASMAVTGACPGTSMVQAGAGMANGIFTMIGGVLGGMAFIKLRPILDAVRERLIEAKTPSTDQAATDSSNKSLDIATAFGLQPVVLLLIWVPMCLAVMQLTFAKDDTVRITPPSGLVPPAYGGLLIGFAQLATTLLAGHAIGASAGYQDVASWTMKKFRPQTSSDDRSITFWTPSVLFSGGVVCAAAALSHLLLNNSSLAMNSLSQIDPIYAVRTIAGGISMVLGARIAGGCTSGHGISGLAKFSLSSLVTTMSLFSAGIITARITAL